MKTYAIENFNSHGNLESLLMSARRVFSYEKRKDFCEFYGVEFIEKHFIRIFPEEKTCILLNAEEIKGEFFSFTHEQFIFLIPSDEVNICQLSREYCHKSQLATFEHEGHTVHVKKMYDVEDLFCAHCGKYLFDDDTKFISMNDGSFFCSEDCAESEGFVKCENCGNYFEYDEMTEINGEDYCSSCRDSNFYTCEHCGDYVSEDDAINIDGNVFCCGDCAESEGYACCENCGDYYEQDDDNDTRLCSYCIDRATERAKRYINSYGYKPNYDFYHTPEDIAGYRLYFGMEVENAFPFGHFEKGILDLHNISEEENSFHYLKHDSTAGDLGVEIVTMPATLNYLVSEEGKRRINAIFDSLSENNAYKHSECGMHVHISRAGIFEAHEIKLEIFFQRHREQLEHIAGRRGNGYCNYPPKSRDYTYNGGENCRAYNQHGRYRALNWENPRTLEIRIFDSVLNVKDFYKNVEFCHAVYQFTKSAKIEEIEKDDFSKFSEFVGLNASRYPNLNDFLNN